MPHSRDLNRISFEEKGQRAMRSTDVYRPDKGYKEVTVCRKCHAYYFNKRWYLDEAELRKVTKDDIAGMIVCPACLRTQDNNPEGVVVLKGGYLLAHEDEILNIIRNTEAEARRKNPLARIMEIKQEDDELTILTTDDKLAEKLGRNVNKSHKGDLHYSWGRDQDRIRVRWERGV